jgi:hypothetical protein
VLNTAASVIDNGNQLRYIHRISVVCVCMYVCVCYVCVCANRQAMRTGSSQMKRPAKSTPAPKSTLALMLDGIVPAITLLFRLLSSGCSQRIACTTLSGIRIMAYVLHVVLVPVPSLL